jgi:mercuric ion binding protein
MLIVPVLFPNPKIREMKQFIGFCLIIAGITFLAPEAKAQSKKKIETVEFEVSGVCVMCEKRIEDAALIKGVRLAQWDKLTQKIKVIYSTKKVTLEDIHEAIAKAGHDTEKVKAKDEVYLKLPDCCLYRTIEVH